MCTRVAEASPTFSRASATTNPRGRTSVEALSARASTACLPTPAAHPWRSTSLDKVQDGRVERAVQARAGRGVRRGGYAKCTGKVGVCIGRRAGAPVTGLADALLDSVPMVAITGQAPRRMIGTDASGDAHRRDHPPDHQAQLPRHGRERIRASSARLRSSGRPGPCSSTPQASAADEHPVLGTKVSPTATSASLPRRPPMERVLDMIKDAKRLYAGGGCLDAAPELKEFIESTGISITNTLKGLGCYPASDEPASTCSGCTESPRQLAVDWPTCCSRLACASTIAPPGSSRRSPPARPSCTSTRRRARTRSALPGAQLKPALRLSTRSSSG